MAFGLQLEVAALAAWDGFTVVLEVASPRVGQTERYGPRRDGQEMRVETFLLLPDEGTQGATAFWDKFGQDTLWIGGEFNVGISGDIGRRVSGEDYQELLRQIRVAAGQAAATGQRQPVEYAGARLLILPPGEPPKRAGAGCAPTSVTACGCSPPGPALAWATRSSRIGGPNGKWQVRDR